jgi:hypothetical protein
MTLPRTGFTLEKVMSLTHPTPLAPKLCNFLNEHEIVPDISNQVIPAPFGDYKIGHHSSR